MKELVFDLQRFVKGTLGDDTIKVTSDASQVYAYNGNDSIYNYGYDNVTIDAGYGNDTIYSNKGKRSFIKAGYGNDTVYCRSNRSTVDGGADNDTITNITYYSSINGGTGNDSIYNNSYYSTIRGGLGNDKISFGTIASGNIIQFAEGDGADTIYSWRAGNTISLQSDAYYMRSTVGSNVVVSLLSGDAITLSGAKGKTISITGGISVAQNSSINNSISHTLLSGNDSNNSIRNTGGNVTILAQDGNDTINTSKGTRNSINAGAGKDSIYSSSNYSTIDGGTGDDTISNIAPYSSINGGAGNDSIYHNGYYSTILGGSGNDKISLGSSASGNTIKYLAGEGNDTIYGWRASNRISLQTGAYYTRSTVGSNLVVNFLTGGSMTFMNASNKEISIVGGMDNNIDNSISHTLLSGNNYGNSINNTGSYVTISALAGNDTIHTDASTKLSIRGGDGDDSIYCRSNYSTVNGDADNDTITNVTYYSSINGGAGNDDIYNYSYNSTIRGGTGNDYIYMSTMASGNAVQFTAGDGFDSIYGWKSDNTISLQSGAYYVRETVNNNVIVSLQSGDAITLYNAKGKTVSIKGGIQTGKNIINSTANVTLNGTDYHDTISNTGTKVKIYADEGNDYIYNEATKVTISTSYGKDSVILGYADSSSIDTGSNDDFIRGNNNHTTIYAGYGDDTITGNHYDSKIYGGAGNDLISITTYWDNTISGGSGNDTIYADGNEHSVSGGAGNDKISLSGTALTVKGDSGNDTIYGDISKSHLYQYAKGDGNDIIYNWSSNDTLTITGGAYSSRTSGKNVLVSIAGGNTITLSGAKGKTININGNKNSVVDDEVLPQDVIRKFMLSLDNATVSNITTMLDNAVKSASNNKFTTIQKAIDSMVSDCKSYSGDWKSFLKDKCDIDLDNDDTGAISGYDAGNSTYEKTENSIVEETGSVDKTFTGNNFSVNGLNVYLAKTTSSSVQTINYNDNSLSDKERYIWQGLRSWWLPGALNLIEESYGSNFGFSNNSSSTIQNNRLYVTFYNNSSDNVLASVGTLNNTSKNIWRDSKGNIIGSLKLNINMNYYSSIIEDNEDGKRSNSNSFYLDRVLAHEFTHAVMNANIRYATGEGGLSQIIKDGMAELTHGIDDERESDIKAYASDSKTLDNALDVTKIYKHYPAYAGGYMFLRYLAKQASNTQIDKSSYSGNSIRKLNSSPKGLVNDGELLTATSLFKKNSIYLYNYSAEVTKVNATVLSSSVEIMGNAAYNSIKSGASADTLYGGAGDDTIYGGADDDIIYGGSDDDKLYGEAGNDTLRGGLGQNTLTGGDGNDIFGYEGGKDYIADFTANEDKIRFFNGAITDSSISGDDVILTTDAGAITVADGKGRQLTIIDADGMESNTVYGGSTLKITKSATTLSSAYVNANASARTKAVKITGNAFDNLIRGGSGKDTLYGGAGDDSLTGGKGNDKLYGQAGDDILKGGSGNDSLWGGAGNDSLYGGAGVDIFTFQAGGGTDTIFDYASGDMLRILKSSGATGGKFSDSSFSDGTLSLTISGGGQVIFNDVTTSTNFKINGTTYRISNSKLVK